MRAVEQQYRKKKPLQLSLAREKNEKAYRYINEQVDTDRWDLNILATTTRFNVKALPENKTKGIVNLSALTISAT